jgi:hypothetical protein
MSIRLNPKWIEEQERILAKTTHEAVVWVLSDPPAIKWIVSVLVTRNIPYRIIRCGGGVTKITTDTSICPKCGGAGKC